MGNNDLFDIKDFLETANFEFLPEKNFSKKVSSVCIDSRKATENSLFVAMKGEKVDGHNFIEKALQNGSKVIFCDENYFSKNREKIKIWCENFGAVFVSFKNTLSGLQKIAKFYAGKFPQLKKVAITGSNGKTTTKELIAAVLSQKFDVVKNDGNLNSDSGLPLSVFKIRKNHEIGIFEMGMNRKGEISELAEVLKPNFAIITNIGTAHIGLIGSQKNIAIEKRHIFDNFDENSVGFVNENNAFCDFLFENAIFEKKIFGEKALNIKNIKENGLSGFSFDFENVKINFPLSGRHNLENAFAAISVGKYFGVENEKIKAGLENCQTLSGRMTISESENLTIINDAYNANFDSMAASLDFCDSAEFSGKKIYVLGEMRELGEKSNEIHEKICERLKKSSATKIFLLGECFENATKKTNFSEKNVEFLKNFEDDEKIENEICGKTLILFKGSNSMQLWKTAEKFAAMTKAGGKYA